MTATAAPAYRYIGITDECVECQKCGKNELRSTVVLAMLDVDGNVEDITYYGSSCAAKALGIRGGGRGVLNSARAAHDQTIEIAKFARRTLEFYGLPLEGEPSEDVLRAARRLYVRSNNNVADLVARTGKTVTWYVLDMLNRKREEIALAALLGR